MQMTHLWLLGEAALFFPLLCGLPQLDLCLLNRLLILANIFFVRPILPSEDSTEDYKNQCSQY